MKTMKVRVLFGACLAVLGQLPQLSVAADDPDLAYCFRPADYAKVKHEVAIVDMPKSAHDSNRLPVTSFAYPGTLLSSRPTKGLPEIPRKIPAKLLHLLWVNRCHNIKSSTSGTVTSSLDDCRNIGIKTTIISAGNEDLGVQGRFAYFSTYAKADACTVIQARRLMHGESDALLAKVAEAAGLEYLPRISNMADYQKKMEQLTFYNGLHATGLLDKCVPPTDQASPAQGLSLDYEVADWRPAQRVSKLMGALGNVAHRQGRVVYLATHELSSENNAYGLDRNNFRRVLSSIDFISINVPTGASMGNPANPARGVPGRDPKTPTKTQLESYQRTLNEIERKASGDLVPFSPDEQKKILWGVGLYYTDLDDAKALYNEFFVKNQYGGVAIQPAYVSRQGGCDRVEIQQDKTVQVNQVIACMAPGVCNGKFRIPR